MGWDKNVEYEWTITETLVLCFNAPEKRVHKKACTMPNIYNRIDSSHQTHECSHVSLLPCEKLPEKLTFRVSLAITQHIHMFPIYLVRDSRTNSLQKLTFG